MPVVVGAVTDKLPADALEIREMWRTSQKVGSHQECWVAIAAHSVLTLCHCLSRQYADRSPADIISTVEFDHTGNYLATGDKGGRVVLFERNETVRTAICE
jgi:hypothetical protein